MNQAHIGGATGLLAGLCVALKQQVVRLVRILFRPQPHLRACHIQHTSQPLLPALRRTTTPTIARCCQDCTMLQPSDACTDSCAPLPFITSRRCMDQQLCATPAPFQAISMPGVKSAVTPSSEGPLSPASPFEPLARNQLSNGRADGWADWRMGRRRHERADGWADWRMGHVIMSGRMGGRMRMWRN